MGHRNKIEKQKTKVENADFNDFGQKEVLHYAIIERVFRKTVRAPGAISGLRTDTDQRKDI